MKWFRRIFNRRSCTQQNLLFLSNFRIDNDSSENAQNVNVIKPSAARQRRRELLATLALREPKLQNDLEIDLTTDEVYLLIILRLVENDWALIAVCRLSVINSFHRSASISHYQTSRIVNLCNYYCGKVVVPHRFTSIYQILLSNTSGSFAQCHFVNNTSPCFAQWYSVCDVISIWGSKGDSGLLVLF